MRRRTLHPFLLGFQYTVDVNLNVIVACVGLFDFFGSCVPSFTHGPSVVLFGFRIEWAFGAIPIVCTMWRLAKMGIILDSLLA
jgi:hypothetical protein